MAAEVIGTKRLDFIEYHQLLKISLPSKKNLQQRGEKSRYKRLAAATRCENKGKDRPARTPHVAFVVVSHYRLQIIFFALTSMFPRDFPFFIKDDRRYCKICFQQGLVVYQTPLFHPYLF